MSDVKSRINTYMGESYSVDGLVRDALSEIEMMEKALDNMEAYLDAYVGADKAAELKAASLAQAKKELGV